MGFNIKATIGADGSGFFREMGKIEASAKGLETKAAKYADEAKSATTERIALEQRLLLLKKGEANLTGRVASTQSDDDLTKRRAASSATALAAVKVERAERERVEKEAARATRDRVTATSSLAKLESNIAKQRERVAILTGAGDTVGSEKALLKQTAMEGNLVTAKARVVLTTHEQAKAEAALASQIASRGARLAQLENRSAKLASAAASAKAGSEQHDRLSAALKRVQQQATKTTSDIERLGRAAATSGAAAARATEQAAMTRGGKFKAAAGEFGGGLLGGFGGAMGAAAAGVAIAALAHKTVEYGGRINDLSARLGVSTDALQEFDYAMTLNGATLEDATAAMQKLGVARQEALEQGGEKMDAFKALGISAEQLKTMRLEDLFKTIGRSVRDAADVQTVMADAIQVMGKGSGNVLAAMRADLEAAGEEARRLGLIIGADTIAKLDELGDQSATVGKRLMAGIADPLLFVVEVIHKIVDGFKVAASFTARWAEMLGKISAGVSFKVAIQEKDDGIQSDLRDIAAGSDARGAGRTTAPRGDAALNFAGDGVAVQEAAKVVALREKIAKLDRDALPLAEKRAAIEAEIAKKRAELAEVEASQDTSQGGAGEKRALELAIALRESEKELAGLKEGKGFESQQNTDSLSKKGLFIGAGPAGVTVAPLTGQQATREFARMVQTMERLIAVNENGHNRVVTAVGQSL